MRSVPSRLFGCVCCPPPVLAASALPPLNRRNFLSGGAAALGLGGTVLSAPAVRAQAQAAPRRIDVHHHFMPAFHLEAISARRTGSSVQWSLAKSLEDMDKTGTATAIVSIVQPGAWVGDAEKSRKLARQWNEFVTENGRAHPGRFGLWAALPLPDVDGALREIEYALDVLKADGVGLMTSTEGKYLGDPAYTPIFEELNRRKAVVYTHPATPQCCVNLVPGTPPGTIEYATDTTRTIASLLFNGVATRYPDIRFIFSHSGGTLPFLVGRFVRQAQAKKYPFLPQGPIPVLQRFYYEIAQGNTPGQLAALFKLSPLAHVMFGTDFPFRPGAEAVSGMAEYGFDPADTEAINRDNALALLPRLKT